ncbi:uncharacterized protein LOC131849688 [Achroia grisella]|uniref:uncharacterized protein LOC131849688 n=1 Tax=Achroia grisella TaxID=688607 RepID=UPI0027D27791|nr:uncharacterized protein LOC131849688 [Achroia grisella]
MIPVEPTKACVPTSTVHGPCHTCVCNIDGVYYCRADKCKNESEYKTLQRRECESNLMYTEDMLLCTCNDEGYWTSTNCRTNESHWNNHNSDLPRIRNGESCIPGKIYRLDCNTCRCGEQNSLLCTKMACLTEEDLNVIFHERKPKGVQEPKDVINLRTRMTDIKYPDIPSAKCIPGKLYKKGCKKCFCNEKGIVSCTKNVNCYDRRSIVMLTPNDVRPRFKEEDLNSLEMLPNAATKCEPGKAYKVDCNTCLCLVNKNLLCSKVLCLSLDDMHRVDANKRTGKPCNRDEYTTDIECLLCSCVKGVTQCKAIAGCKEELTALRLLHGEYNKWKPRLTLSLKEDKCLAQTIYKDDCNKCYCQDDGTLRCTQKTCLNYVQTLQLKKHRLYLQKYGL